MSSDVLSQFDIDRLLGGAGAALPTSGAGAFGGAGATHAATGAVDQEISVYDFRRPHRVSKERLRTLEAMYERLCKSLEAWLVSRVRGHVELRLQSVEQFSFGEFTLSLPTPCATYIFDIKGSGGVQGVIDIGHEFAYFLIDRLFGGAGSTSMPGRALSPVERLAVRTVGERVAQLLEEIWFDHIPLELQVTGFESSPEILQIANREDPVLVANVEVVAGQSSSLMLMCLPFAVLEKFFQSQRPAPRRHRRRIGARAEGVAQAHRARPARDAGHRGRPSAAVPDVAARSQQPRARPGALDRHRARRGAERDDRRPRARQGRRGPRRSPARRPPARPDRPARPARRRRARRLTDVRQ